MNRKKVWLAFLACIVMFAAAVWVSVTFSGDGTENSGGTGNSPVVLSEILASNRTYPAPNGQYLDFIEVRNVSDSPVDISGYMLSDTLDSIGYTFPQSTVLPAGGYLAVWCDKNAESDSYAKFGISKDGTDSIYLYNSVNVMMDSVDIPRVDINVPLIRQEDGTWVPYQQATPGFENSDAGFASWLGNTGADEIHVVISEVVTGSDCVSIDGTGKVCDWVELYNQGSTTAVLDGMYLSDDTINRIKWQIPALSIGPGERAVIRCVGFGAVEGEADFALPRDGCTVVLSGTMGNIISQVEVPQIGKDNAWALHSNGIYEETAQLSPGYENNEDGYNAWMSALGIEKFSVVISEVQSRNFSTVLNAAGQLCDWVELYNHGDQAVTLDNAYLSNDPNDRGKWQIQNLTLQPGERVVIRCSGSTAAGGEADFNLSKDGGTVTLTSAMGSVIDQVTFPPLGKDRVWALQSDGTYAETMAATPGYENTAAGSEAYNQTRSFAAGPLIIAEAMPSNSTFNEQSDGKCYDWVELRNISDETIDLSDYYLSDDPDLPKLFQLPGKKLKAGECVVITCSGSAQLTGNHIYAPFTLGRDESWVYLTGSDGSFVDILQIYDVPYQGSVGRMDGDSGTYYFTTPTPGASNGTGVAFVSATPVVETPDGVFNNVGSIEVTISGANVRYTTDGSIPTARSTAYTGPITLTGTTVIRAVSFQEGGAPSDVVTASYIINENHTLPVVSLALDDDDIFGAEGIYTKYRVEKEVLCNVTLYEESGEFSIDCGIEMFGHTGLKDPKKSFKINFRGRYGDPYLNYEVFGDKGPAVYESLLIRAGQDYPKSIFRDELFTSLCKEGTDNVLTQHNKFCILYINGEYFGIYCLKEAYSETYYAENEGVTVDTVEVVQAPFAMGTELYDLYKYCRENDLREAEHYEYVTSKIDIDSMIDWMIFEAYCTNGDVQQNLRYFRSSENGGKWQFAYYDLDWAFYYYNGFIHVLDPGKTWQHLGFTRGLAKNAEFRQQLLERCSYFMNGTLSNENVLAKIDYYYELLKPEVERERERWTGSYDAWENEVNKLRSFITDRDHWGSLINHLYRYVNLTDAEAEQYFGR